MCMYMYHCDCCDLCLAALDWKIITPKHNCTAVYAAFRMSFMQAVSFCLTADVKVISEEVGGFESVHILVRIKYIL